MCRSKCFTIIRYLMKSRKLLFAADANDNVAVILLQDGNIKIKLFIKGTVSLIIAFKY